MIRNLKTFGLALVAVLALGAVAASVASASFDSEAEITKLSGGQTTTHEFTVEAGTTTCEEASFPGESTGEKKAEKTFTTTSLTIHPEYKKCKTKFGSEFHNTTVNMNGCYYTFTAGTTTSETTIDGTVHIICVPAGNEIKVEVEGLEELCTVTVPEQTVPVLYHNQGSGTTRDVLVTADVTKELTYTQHGRLCPGNGLAKTKTFTNGTYTGSTTEKGANSQGTQVGIWVT